MSGVSDLKGAITAPETPKEAKRRRENEAKERERVKVARARQIRSKYGAGTFEERQALGTLKPYQAELHGGVKLGSLEPMIVGRPGADTLTGVDFMNSPVYFANNGSGRSTSGKMSVFSRRSQISFGRAQDRTSRVDVDGDANPIEFDVDLIDLTFKSVKAVDAKYLFKYSGVPPCGQRDFETLNSELAPVSASVRVLVPSNPDKVRVIRPRHYPFYKKVLWGHDAQTRLFTEALGQGDTRTDREYPHPYGTFARNSVSEIYTKDANGDVYRRMETEYDHIMNDYTERFSTDEYPVRMSSELDVIVGQSSSGTDLVESFEMPSLVMPGDGLAIFEVRPDRFTRLC